MSKEEKIKKKKEGIEKMKNFIKYREEQYQIHWWNGDFSFMYSDLAKLYVELIEIYMDID